MNVRPFHLALPTEDLELTRHFYCDILGCETGRTSNDWIDLDFFAHVMSQPTSAPFSPLPPTGLPAAPNTQSW